MLRNKKWLFVLLVFLVVLITSFYVWQRGSNMPQAKLDILAAPSGTSLELDGKGIKSGLHSVKTGQHVIVASKNGFASHEESVTLTINQTRFIGIILKSNSPSTATWYKDHDSDLVQSINNKLFSQVSKDAIKDDPLLKKLPHIGPALAYRIDYGIPSTSTKTGQPAVYIRYRTDKDKQAAIQWITSQGADINKLDTIYLQGNF